MVWNFAAGKKERQAFRYIGHSAAVTSVAFDATHNLIASSSKDKTVRLWKPSAEGRSTVLKAHTAAVRACAFSANGCMLATCSDDKTVKVWSVPQQSFLCSLNGHTNWVRTCQLSPDARLAVSGGDDHTVRVWDVETRATVSTFEELDGSTATVARFHPDGNCVATGGSDGCLKLWDLRSARIIQYYDAHDGAVTDAAFHPSGNFLLSSSKDGTLKVWDLQEGLLLYTLHGHDGPTLGVNFSPAGGHFISGGADGQVMSWRTNFDSCLTAAAAAWGDANGGNDSGCCTGSSSSKQQGGQVAWKPFAKGCTAASAGDPAGPKTAPPARHAPPAIAAPNTIAAVRPSHRPQQQAAGPLVAVQQQEHAADSCAGLDAGLAGVLQQLVSQLDVLTSTVAAMEERVTISEDRGRRMDATLAQLLAQQQQQPALPARQAAPLPEPLPVQVQQQATQLLAAGPAVAQPSTGDKAALNGADAAGDGGAAALQQQLDSLPQAAVAGA
ncbi:hypothetical protein ABPG75_009790 [Micractinium tetrahymenae]